MKQVNIALLGCGQVGTGLVELLQQQRNFIERRTGIRLGIKHILVKDSNKKRQVQISGLTKTIRHILDDKEIEIVVELIGGLEPARSYILDSLKSGKHIVTVNKAVLAHHGSEIEEMAQRMGREVYYEAAVCAGIPVIRSIKEGLLANHISLLMGVLNGTTNYILTRMSEEGIPFDKALRKAQQHGFAEPDPSMDIQGIDAAHKLNILARLSFGIKVRPQDIYKEGISGIELEDIKNALEFGYVIKLLSIARELDHHKLELKVHPSMIPKVHPLAAVRNEFNALLLRGNAVGEMMFYGKGAGPMPTASAILSDIIELCMRSLNRACQVFHHSDPWGDKSLIPMDETISEHYLRFPIEDKPGVIGKIATVLGEHNISIYGATASLVPVKKALGNVRVLTKKAKEAEIKKAISEINRLPIMRGKTVIIRIEE